MPSSASQQSDNVDPAPLGQPLHFLFSGLIAPNRFLKAAMTERMASWDPRNPEARGVPSKLLVNLYKRWGEGEAGLILSGNIMIDPEHLEAPGNMIIPPGASFSGDRFDGFKDMATAGKAHGSLMVGQVSHPGRQVTDKIQKNPISASDVQLEGNLMGMTFAKPRPASQKDIDDVIHGFAHAAEYLDKAGWNGIQLHAAHGYLLAQFLATSTNKRTDKYGGDLENRARIIIEIAQAVRSRTRSDFSIGIKLNSVEFQDKGFQPEEARALCRLLEQNGFDYVELSGGTYESLAFKHRRESTVKREAFFIEFAELIAPGLTKTKTYVTGGFKTVGAMATALKTVDGVGIGRAICQEPRLPREILQGKVKGASNMKIDENDFGVSSMAAGAQMKQIGKDQEPVDLSDDDNVQAFMKDVGAFVEKMGKDTAGSEYGHPDLAAVPLPYGTVSG